jgi:opacity protein-like surface antigen
MSEAEARRKAALTFGGVQRTRARLAASSSGRWNRSDDFVGDQSRTTFGGSLATMSGGIFGVEGDFGFTPKFFGTDVELGGVPISVAKNNVLTAMGNLTIGVPLQSHGGPGIRPYAVGGIGLIRQEFDVVGGLVGYTANDLGYNVGGGVLIFPSEHVGIRGDIRYFRSVGANTVAICWISSPARSTSLAPRLGSHSGTNADVDRVGQVGRVGQVERLTSATRVTRATWATCRSFTRRVRRAPVAARGRFDRASHRGVAAAPR